MSSGGIGARVRATRRAGLLKHPGGCTVAVPHSIAVDRPDRLDAVYGIAVHRHLGLTRRAGSVARGKRLKIETPEQSAFPSVISSPTPRR
jgi:hypothetical protein